MPVLTLTPAQSDALDLIGSAFEQWQDRGQRLNHLLTKYGADLPDDAKHPLTALAELLQHPAIQYCQCQHVSERPALHDDRCPKLAIWQHQTPRGVIWRYCQTHAAEYERCDGCGDIRHRDDLDTRIVTTGDPVPNAGEELRLCAACLTPDERQKDDDDGSQYADPRDERDERGMA